MRGEMKGAKLHITNPRTGETHEYDVLGADLEYTSQTDTATWPMYFPMPLSMTFTSHLTRRNVLNWRKVFNLPSGRRAARRRHHKRMRKAR